MAARAGSEMVGTAEAARMLGVLPGTVARWARQGAQPGVRLPGGHYRFRVADLEALLRPAEEALPPTPREEEAEHEAGLQRLRAMGLKV